MRAKVLLISMLMSVLVGCQSVNPKTVAEMPTGYLCDLLGPNWITLPDERRAIYAELEKRRAECLTATYKVINR